MLLLRIHNLLVDESVKQGIFHVFSVERTRVDSESALRLDTVGNESVHRLVKRLQKSDAETRDEMPFFVRYFNHTFCVENIAEHNESFHNLCHRFPFLAVENVGLFGGELNVVFHNYTLIARRFLQSAK